MGAIRSIVERISDEVVDRLADAGYPPLTDGRILFGLAAVHENSRPPRIIMEPVGSAFSMRDIYSASAVAATQERREQNAQRAIEQEAMQFAVRFWGAADPDAPDYDPVDDYDVTRALYHCFIAAVQKLAAGSFTINDTGKYTTGTEHVRLGREFVRGLTLYTPVLTSLLPYDRARQYAPDDVVANSTDNLVIPTGQSETAC